MQVISLFPFFKINIIFYTLDRYNTNTNNTHILLSIMTPNILSRIISELHTFDFILIGMIGFPTKKEGQYNK